MKSFLTSILPALLALLGPSASFAQVTTDSLYLRISGKRHFVIGTYSLPPGISLDDVRNAGFNFAFEDVTPAEAAAHGLQGGIMLYDTMDIPQGGSTVALQDTVRAYMGQPGLITWYGTDEPAWQNPPVPPDDLARGYQVIRNTDRQLLTPRPVWLNHAARGTQAAPDSFQALVPYDSCADLFSMDIYPVPPWFGGSNLPNQQISCVGEYTRILENVLRNPQGFQTKPVWMVLQGFSWTDFNFAGAWLKTTRSVYDFGKVQQAVAGDFNGDGLTDVALLYSTGIQPTSQEMVLVALSTGSAFRPFQNWVVTTYGAFPFDHVSRAAAADMNGDGQDDLVLFYHNPTDRQKIVVAPSNGHGFDWYQTWLDTTAVSLKDADVYGLAAGHFDGGTLPSLALAYGGPDTASVNPQEILVLKSDGARLGAPAVWRTEPRDSFPFERMHAFLPGDFDGDRRDDLAVLYDNPAGTTDLQVMSSDGASFASRSIWWDSLATDFPVRRVSQVTSQDLDGNGRSDLVLFYSDADSGEAAEWLIAALAGGSHFHQERWGVVSSLSYDFKDLRFAMGGDYDGNGLGDFCVVHDYRWPVGDPNQRLEVATSYGEKFGVPGPSPQESRFMAYDAVVNGATGLVWWGLYYSGGPYAVWQGVRQTSQEMALLEDALVRDDATQTVAVSDTTVETRMKGAASDGYLLIAANRSANTLSCAITSAALAGQGAAQVVFEGRTVPVSGDTLRDTYYPWDVHVYSFGLKSGVGKGANPAGSPGSSAGLRADPAPFTDMVTLRFTQERPGEAEVAIYDLRGRLVRRLTAATLDAGEHEVRWDGRDSAGAPAAGGLYLARLSAPGQQSTRKILKRP